VWRFSFNAWMIAGRTNIMIRSYLINLDKDTDRLAFVQDNFSRCGVEFERIAAVDGRLFSDEDYQAFMVARPRGGKIWMRGQMGCFLSHYAAWAKIAEGDGRFGAVFEDDIHISPDLKQLLSDDSWLPDSVDIVRLDTSTTRVRMSSRPVLTHAGRKLYEMQSTSWCAGGYLLNKRCAQQLLALPTAAHQPSDALLYSLEESAIARQFKVWQCNPALCTQDKHSAGDKANFSSNIENPVQARVSNGRPPINLANLVRALYRSISGYKRIEFE
jgi:glycosyl transferase family 25